VERLREAADEKRTKANKAREENTHEKLHIKDDIY
jgi:hypothetical protein